MRTSRQLPDACITECQGWLDGNSISGSVYLGITDHQVLRAHVASNAGSMAVRIGEVITKSDDTQTRERRITDGGVGWQVYSNGQLDGWMLELGPLLRVLDTYRSIEDSPQITTKTAELAARALVGYSLKGEHWFFAAAVGISAGYEWGNERHAGPTHHDDMLDTIDASVNRSRVTAEGFIRIGYAFDYETTVSTPRRAPRAAP